MRLSRTITRTVPPEPTKRALVELGPDLRARLPHQQPHRFARVAERQDEEPRAPVLARLRIAHHRPVAVIDLAFLAGRRGDDDARLGRRRAAQRQRRSGGRSHTGAVKPWSSTRSCQIAIALRPRRERLGDQLAIRLARARARRSARAAAGAESVDTSALVAGFAGRSRWTPRCG